MQEYNKNATVIIVRYSLNAMRLIFSAGDDYGKYLIYVYNFYIAYISINLITQVINILKMDNIKKLDALVLKCTS